MWARSPFPVPMTDPTLLLPDTRLDEIERDAAHSRRLGLDVTFAVVAEQAALVSEIRRLRSELADARSAVARLRAAGGPATVRTPTPGRNTAIPTPPPPPVAPPERYADRFPPFEVEVAIVRRDVDGREVSRVRQRVPLSPGDERRAD